MLKSITILITSLLGCNNSQSKKVDSQVKNIIYFKPIDANYLDYLNVNNIEPESYSLDDFYKENNDHSTAFFSNKPKEEIYYDIFSSYARYETFRRAFVYNNPEEIQQYFLKKYNKCFFPKDYKNEKWKFSQKQLFSYERSINFEDFKTIILPNFKLSFFTEFSLNKLKPKKNNYNIIFNWDFFNDKAYLNTENSIYRSNHLYREKRNTPILNYFDAIFYSLEFLFEYPFSTADTRLNGLSFEKEPLRNKTISKYFEYSKKRKCLILKERNFKNFYEQNINSESNLKSDFEELQKFFDKKIPFVKIIEK